MKKDMRTFGIMLTMFIMGIVVLVVYSSGSDNQSRIMGGFGTGLIVGSITYFANNIDVINKKAVGWTVVGILILIFDAILMLLIAELTSHDHNLKTIVLGFVGIIALTYNLVLQVIYLRKLHRE